MKTTIAGVRPPMNIADLFLYGETRRCQEILHLAVASRPLAFSFIVDPRFRSRTKYFLLFLSLGD